MTDYLHNSKYYWHLPEVTSTKSNYRMSLLVIIDHHYFAPHTSTRCKYRMFRTLLEEWVRGMTGSMYLFWEMYVLLHNRQKRYTKLFTLAVFSMAFSVVPPLEVVQKIKSRKKGKSVTRLRTFLEVSTKFENTKSLLFSVLL